MSSPRVTFNLTCGKGVTELQNLTYQTLSSFAESHQMQQKNFDVSPYCCLENSSVTCRLSEKALSHITNDALSPVKFNKSPCHMLLLSPVEFKKCPSGCFESSNGCATLSILGVHTQRVCIFSDLGIEVYADIALKDDKYYA